MARAARGGGSLEVIRAAVSRIREGDLAPLYFIHGEEGYLRDEVLRALRRAVLGEEARDFCHDSFYWETANAADISAAAQTLPLAGARRLVEVHGIGQVDEGGASVLLPLIGDPPPSAVMVFTAEKADMRRTFFRKLGEAGVTLRAAAPTERELPAWAQSRAEALGFTLTRDAAMLLAEWVEPSLGRIGAELEKLASYVKPGEAAGEDAVRDLVGRSKVEAMYKLGDALVAGDVPRSLALARDLSEGEKGPPFLIGFLRNQVRRWTIAKAAARKKMPDAELAEILGVKPFVAGRAKQNVRGVSAKFLRGLYGGLLKVDRRVKRAGREKAGLQALELFIMDLARDPGGFAGSRGGGYRKGAARG